MRNIQTALGPGARSNERRTAAREALRIAEAVGWHDHRRAFSHFALGRLDAGHRSRTSHKISSSLPTNSIKRTPDTDLHRAYTASQLAAYAIAQGRGEDALMLLGPHLATAERHENAALLATLMMLRAEALELSGRVAEAQPSGWTVWAGRATALARTGPCAPNCARSRRSARSRANG